MNTVMNLEFHKGREFINQLIDYQITQVLWTPKVHYLLCKIPLMDHDLSQTNLILTVTPYF
jgi:hypothetical protein